MTVKRLFSLVVVSIICFFGVILCHNDNRIKSENLPVSSGPDEAFYVTTDFILRLNVLIKHLAMYSLNDTLDAREAIRHADKMWNYTALSLEALVLRSRPAIELLPSRNFTNSSLHAALDVVRTERDNFLSQTSCFSPSLVAEIDAMSFIDRTNQPGGVVPNPDIKLLMQSSVHRLSKVSEGLLRTLRTIRSNKRGGQPRANPTQASVELFIAGFQRHIVDTRLNFETQANRLLSRVSAQLATLTLTPVLGQYLTNYSKLIETFTKNVSTHLNNTSIGVLASMNTSRTTVDMVLSAGNAGLLTAVAMSNSHKFLDLCLNRYVFPYYNLSQAVAKLLFCGEPELRTLEYLVTGAIPILDRAAISDSSAVKMAVICSSGSTACLTDYDNSLPAQFMAAQVRMESYVEFINQELLGLGQRVSVCANATVLDVGNYVNVTSPKFATCLSTGRN
ncbi:uncharacterized protein LOC118513699 [Anopheles stephensi]|uniref:uncharacterized protein LOC118513699 n=1 Tax=Anopheles stephensi TaxID=30069 RepID=UPI001658C18E|nr:uncharacterized protein LOC118513699 [Anopheles stephensi]